MPFLEAFHELNVRPTTYTDRIKTSDEIAILSNGDHLGYVFLTIGVKQGELQIYFGDGPRHEEQNRALQAQDQLESLNYGQIFIHPSSGKLNQLHFKNEPGKTEAEHRSVIIQIINRINPNLITTEPFGLRICWHGGRMKYFYNPETEQLTKVQEMAQEED